MHHMDCCVGNHATEDMPSSLSVLHDKLNKAPAADMTTMKSFASAVARGAMLPSQQAHQQQQLQLQAPSAQLTQPTTTGSSLAATAASGKRMAVAPETDAPGAGSATPQPSASSSGAEAAGMQAILSAVTRLEGRLQSMEESIKYSLQELTQRVAALEVRFGSAG
eukprot:jgi/Chrzof1/10822/Cz05g13130.t1